MRVFAARMCNMAFLAVAKRCSHACVMKRDHAAKSARVVAATLRLRADHVRLRGVRVPSPRVPPQPVLRVCFGHRQASTSGTPGAICLLRDRCNGNLGASRRVGKASAQPHATIQNAGGRAARTLDWASKIAKTAAIGTPRRRLRCSGSVGTTARDQSESLLAITRCSQHRGHVNLNDASLEKSTAAKSLAAAVTEWCRKNRHLHGPLPLMLQLHQINRGQQRITARAAIALGKP